jgi:D-beta-D-heptose 7-phosphate kinase/D-beta-D-heptose 1-phosphate adenosyltransferase
MANLHTLLHSFTDKRILVIGDLMLDEYMLGEITRISPEAPVPIVKVDSHYFSLGGAANVARNIAKLGGRSSLFGIVGDDYAGQCLKQMAKDENIKIDGIFVDKMRPTTAKVRILASKKQLLRVDKESSEPLGKTVEDSLLGLFQKAIKNADAVVISDYNKGVITKNTSKQIIALAKKAKLPILADSKNYLEFELVGATILKPNLKELSKEIAMELKDEHSIGQAAWQLNSKLKPEAVLVTMGEHGMLLLEKGKIQRIPGIKSKAIDVSGAGDTVISVMALGLAAGGSVLDSARLANHAAAIVVEKLGTAFATVSEIESRLK